MRIPLTVDLDIESYTSGSIDLLNAGITNGMINKRPNTAPHVTQRPGIDINVSASAVVTDVRGRGVYYWDAKNARYFVNNSAVYKNSYASQIGTIAAGSNKVKFLLLADKLIMLDKQGNAGHIITTGDVVIDISHANFPPNISPAKTLCYGGAGFKW